MSIKEELLLVQKVRDLTVCCICLDTFSDPRRLSCRHAFCLQCITGYITVLKKALGEEAACPVCKKCFVIPLQGLDGLQIDFTMKDIIDSLPFSNPVVAGPTLVLCEVCAENVDQNSGRIGIPPAEMFCMQCGQKLCRECAFHHKRNKMTKLHHLVPHETELNWHVDVLDSAVLRLCEKHVMELLIYCEHCKEAVCPGCFLEKHGLHKFVYAKQLINNFKEESDNRI